MFISKIVWSSSLMDWMMTDCEYCQYKFKNLDLMVVDQSWSPWSSLSQWHNDQCQNMSEPCVCPHFWLKGRLLTATDMSICFKSEQSCFSTPFRLKNLFIFHLNHGSLIFDLLLFERVSKTCAKILAVQRALCSIRASCSFTRAITIFESVETQPSDFDQKGSTQSTATTRVTLGTTCLELNRRHFPLPYGPTSPTWSGADSADFPRCLSWTSPIKSSVGRWNLHHNSCG